MNWLEIKKETTHGIVCEIRVPPTKRRHLKRTPLPHNQCARFHVFGAHVGLSGSSSSSSARSSSTSSPFIKSVQFGMMSLELKMMPYMPVTTKHRPARTTRDSTSDMKPLSWK
jgi:hypothetical protein